MFNGKNHVGRPTNEEVKKRKNKKLILYISLILIVLIAIMFVSTGSFSSLMGNSITEYNCLSTDYSLEGTNCVKKIEMDFLILGDVDLDGIITENDYSELVKLLNEDKEKDLTPMQYAVSDIDKNNEVNYLDASIIKDYLNSKLSTYSGYYDMIGIEKVCPKDYELNGIKCVKKVIIPAVAKKSDSSSDQSYTVTFDANGGIGEMENISANINEDIKLPKNNFKNGDIKFLGWNIYNKTTKQWVCYSRYNSIKNFYEMRTDCQEYGKYKFTDGGNIPKDIVKAKETLVLYAVWDKKSDSSSNQSYTVTFNANGGSGSMKNVSANISKSFRLPKNNFKKNNRKFLGWNIYNKTIKQWVCYSRYNDKKSVGNFYELKSNCQEYGKYKLADGGIIPKDIVKAKETLVLYAVWG